MFRRLFLQRALSSEWEYLRSTSNAPAVCFAPWVYFVLQSKIRAFGATAFLFPTTVLAVDRESPSSFMVSAHFRFGSWFTAVKSDFCTAAISFIDIGLCFLLAVVPSDTKWPGHWSAQNKVHNANGAVTKDVTRVEWQSCPHWLHAGAMVANCFCNFYHTVESLWD